MSSDYCLPPKNRKNTTDGGFFFVLFYLFRSYDISTLEGYLIPKIRKMVLDIALLNTQQYKVHIKGKVE